jgi:nucleoid DNA-binding protein
VNKGELVDAMADASGLSKADAERALNSFIESVQSAVAKGDKVMLPGFGAFAPTQRSARIGRNPRTGEAVKIAASKAPAVFLADQDDLWSPEKTRVYLEHLEKAGKKWGPKTPLLVHGDLAVVDRRGKLIHRSFWKQQGLDPRRNDLRYLLVQNFVTGCAALVNRSLVKAALPLPPETRMHDWWLAQTAAAFGHLIPVAKPLVQYRQHGGNTVGAKTWSLGSVLARVRDPGGVHQKSLNDSCAQAGALEKRWGPKLPPQQGAMLRDLRDFPKKNAWGRRITLWRHGIARHSFLRTLWHYFTV